MRKPLLVLAAIAAALVSSPAAFAAPTQMLVNPLLGAPYAPIAASVGKSNITGEIANGWTDNSAWGDVDVAYSRETVDTHGESSAQRVVARAIRRGGVQFVQSLPALAGHIYACSVWMKSAEGTTLSVSFRQAVAPYKSYGRSVATLAGVWQRIAFTAAATDDTQAYFMISLPEGADVLVTDASVTDVTASESDAAPLSGNLLPDASFEAGFGGGWSVRCRLADFVSTAKFEARDTRPEIDASTSADQKQSVKVALPSGGTAIVSSPLVAYNYGRVYTASVALKSDVPGAFARLQILGASEVKQYPLTDEWQRYSISARIPYGDATRLTVSESSPGAGNVWFDDAEMHEGAFAAPSPHKPSAELALSVNRPGGVFFDRESAVIRIRAANCPSGATVRATCLDLYGKRSILPAIPATAESVKIASPAAHPRGVFKLTAQLFDAHGKPFGPQISQVFARLPRPRDIDPAKSAFGVHIPLAPAYFDIARATGARWCRIHDASILTKWPVAEPTPGDYRYYDDSVASAKAHGVAILGMLDGAPKWASAQPAATTGYWSMYNHVDAPDALDRFGDYVTRVVSHYRGSIDAWEVWNEPWGKQNSPGSPEIYGQLLKIAYAKAHAANPDAVIVGIDATRGQDAFTEGAMKSGEGSANYDEMSFHEYFRTLYGGPDSQAAKDRAMYGGFERRYGEVRPHWITEAAPEEGLRSFYAVDDASLRIQCAQQVRFDVTELANGVKRVFYYALHADPAEGDYGLIALEHDRTIRPLLAARAVLASLIDGATFEARSEPSPGVDDYAFKQTDGTRVEVLWSYDGARHAVPIPTGAHILDALGNPLPSSAPVTVTAEPVYVVR
jgi:hypothetical protein